jgi:hypothetical protein
MRLVLPRSLGALTMDTPRHVEAYRVTPATSFTYVGVCSWFSISRAPIPAWLDAFWGRVFGGCLRSSQGGKGPGLFTASRLKPCRHHWPRRNQNPRPCH